MAPERTNKPLDRGEACTTCRKRKVKCDSVRPVCGTCRKSALVHGESEETIARMACDFEPMAKPKAAKGAQEVLGGGRKANTKELERRVEELQKVLEERTRASAYAAPEPIEMSSSYLVMEPYIYTDSLDLSVSAVTFNAPVPPVATSLASLQGLPSYNAFPQAGPSDLSKQYDLKLLSELQAPSSLPPAFQVPAGPSLPQYDPAPGPAQGLQGVYLDVFFPGWPKDLPSPPLVRRLVEKYFAMPHTGIGMISKPKFMASLDLPPTHSKFPHRSLLHAMMATSFRYVGEAFTEGEDHYWRTGYGGYASPGDYHLARARAGIDEAAGGGQRLFQVVQASVLVCFYLYMSARIVELFIACSVATRMAIPLGLNTLDPTRPYEPNRPGPDKAPFAAQKGPIKLVQGTPAYRRMKNQQVVAGHLQNLMGPIEDEEDSYERHTTFWAVFGCDRMCSASSNKAVTLDEKDISTMLPARFLPEDTSSLDLSSKGFAVNHISCTVYHLVVKSLVLLGRVSTFVQRRVIHADMRTQNAEFDKETFKQFRILDEDLVTFRMSLPDIFQRQQNSLGSDSRPGLIHAIPYAATILLHEGFATTEAGNVHHETCLRAAQCILDNIYTLWSTSFDAGLMNPFLFWCWAVAGRAFVRDIAVRQARDVSADVGLLKANIDVILTATKSNRLPLADMFAKDLTSLLENPHSSLPNGFVPANPSSFPPGFVSPYSFA